ATTADQRHGAVECTVQCPQQFAQGGVGTYRQRVVDEIEQGAVDVQEQCPACIGGRQGRRRKRDGWRGRSGGVRSRHPDDSNKRGVKESLRRRRGRATRMAAEALESSTSVRM